MEYQSQSPFTPQYQQPLPNASAVLALGIISIPACLCYGIGFIFSIVALVLYNRDNQLYKANPQLYSPTSYSNLRTGRICALIGLIPSILLVMGILFLMMTAGVGALLDPRGFFDNY